MRWPPRVGPAVTVGLATLTVGLAAAALLVSMPAPAAHVVRHRHPPAIPQCQYSSPGSAPSYGPCTGGPPPVVRKPPPLTHKQLTRSTGYYVVKAGDTLWSISHSSLQHPRRWVRLWRLNPKVTNPSAIYPGEVLKL